MAGRGCKKCPHNGLVKNDQNHVSVLPPPTKASARLINQYCSMMRLNREGGGTAAGHRSLASDEATFYSCPKAGGWHHRNYTDLPSPREGMKNHILGGHQSRSPQLVILQGSIYFLTLKRLPHQWHEVSRSNLPSLFYVFQNLDWLVS